MATLKSVLDYFIDSPTAAWCLVVAAALAALLLALWIYKKHSEESDPYSSEDKHRHESRGKGGNERHSTKAELSFKEENGSDKNVKKDPSELRKIQSRLADVEAQSNLATHNVLVLEGKVREIQTFLLSRGNTKLGLGTSDQPSAPGPANTRGNSGDLPISNRPLHQDDPPEAPPSEPRFHSDREEIETIYNEDPFSLRQSRFVPRDFTVANMQAMAKDSNLAPVYRYTPQGQQGEYWYLDTARREGYTVPRPKPTYNLGQFQSAGLDQAFECENFRQGYRYKKLIVRKPAEFQDTGDGQLTLKKRGHLSLKEEEAET